MRRHAIVVVGNVAVGMLLALTGSESPLCAQADGTRVIAGLSDNAGDFPRFFESGG